MSGKAPREFYREASQAWQNDDGRSEGANDRRKKDDDYIGDKHPRNENGERICGARKRSKKGGTLCQMPAGARTDHVGWGTCSYHGGNTPTLRTSAAKYVGGEVIDKMTMAYGYGSPIDINPVEALLQEVRRTGGHVAWLADRIQLWEMVDADGKLTKPIDDVQKQWLQLYYEERDRLVKQAKTALDAGVNERKIRLAERQGEIMIQALNAAFDALGLTREQRKLLPSVMPAVLRAASEPQAQYALDPVQASVRMDGE